MPQNWQEIDGMGPLCHWWQNLYGDRISAMTTVIVTLTVLALLAASLGWLVHLVREDTLAGHTQPSRRVAPDPPRLPRTVAHRR
jgi:hypothetical protein